LARLLVLVVAMGFGVVKPRLGDVKKQIGLLGLVAFVLFAVYGIVHEQSSMGGGSKSKIEMLIIIPVSVLDAAIFWWIFFSLHHTMKILSLRQNTVKLTLYRRFQFVLGCCVIATVAFTIWELSRDASAADSESRYAPGWENYWFTEWGFWQLLFFSILLSIMFLFRPTVNNSRFAYAALDVDLEEDEEYASIPNFGSETMSKRTASSRGKEAPKPKANDIEEELLWVEENIPSTAANDNNFLNFPMDSDEEIMNTRFETSKME